jgi:excisionase family DNA binding protein
MARGDAQLSLQLLANGSSSGRQAKHRKRQLPRLSVSPDEAAEMLGVSRDYFDEHILPDLRIVRRGRRILIALTELERWLDRNAARAGAPTS